MNKQININNYHVKKEQCLVYNFNYLDSKLSRIKLKQLIQASAIEFLKWVFNLLRYENICSGVANNSCIMLYVKIFFYYLYMVGNNISGLQSLMASILKYLKKFQALDILLSINANTNIYFLHILYPVRERANSGHFSE